MESDALKNVDDFLQHHGILGMHWGHRKSSISTITKTGGKHTHMTKQNVKKSSDNVSEDHKTKIKLKGKKLKSMSNTELKTLNERLQLEKTYKELTKADVSHGRKFVTDVLLNVAKQQASAYINKYASKGMDTIFKKATDIGSNGFKKKTGPIGFRP